MIIIDRTSQRVDVKEVSAGKGLTEGYGFSAFDPLDVVQIIADLIFAKRGGGTSEMRVDQAHCTVVCMTGSDGVVTQTKLLDILSPGRFGQVIVERNGLGATGFIRACPVRKGSYDLRRSFRAFHCPPSGTRELPMLRQGGMETERADIAQRRAIL